MNQSATILAHDERNAKAVAATISHLASLTQAAALIGSEQTFLFVNEAYCRKASCNATEIIGRKLIDVIDSAAYDIVRPNFEKALRTRQMIKFSRPWQKPNGTKHWVEFHYLPQFDENGDIWGFHAIAFDRHDITAEEQELLERERMLRHLSDATGNPMFYVDRQEQVQLANQPLLQWLNRSMEEVVGRYAADLFTADALAFYAPLLKRALNGETVMLETHSRARPDGLRRIKISIIPDKRANGEISGAFITAQDVEEDYQLRQALMQRERQLHLFTDNIPEIIAYVDPDRRYKFVNNAFLTYRGAAREEIIGKTLAEVLGREGATYTQPSIDAAFKGEIITYEHEVKLANGASRWHRIRTIPDFDEEGQVQGIYAIGIDIHDVRLAQEALARDEAELRAAMDSLPYPMAYVDRSLKYKLINRSLQALTGISAEVLLDRNLKDVFSPEEYEKSLPLWQRALSGETVTSERLISYSGKAERWMIVKYTPRVTTSGEVLGFYTASIDVDELKRTELELRRANWLLSSHFENTPLAVIEWDPTFRVQRWSPQAEKIFGWREAEVVGKKLTEWQFIFEEDRELVSSISLRLHKHKDPRATSLNRNYRKDGRVIWVEWYNSSLLDDAGNIISIFSLAQDVTTRILAEERLVHQATHDGLTGLPNRIMLQERLRQAITRARRAGTRVAALFIDLDRFKEVNDTLGHRVGDELLRETARRLQSTIRETDLLVRLSGDEFMIVVEQVSELEAPQIVAQKLLTEMRKKFEIDGHEVYMACSIGISLFPDDAEDAETLLKNADMAMYHAKEQGKNRCQPFTRDLAEKGNAMRILENALRMGISRQELLLCVQPKVDMMSQRIIGAEALVRWNHPTRGVIMPGDFIHVAEESGLIHEVGFWVLQATLHTLQAWKALGIETLPIAVNLAAGQFRAPNFAERLLTAIHESGVPPHLLEFEITETGLIRDPEGVGHTLHQIRRVGCRVAIDDFGTGYSSLSHLKRFPIDSIKIDKSFVADLLHDADDRAIVSAVIALANALEIDVVAEGVENEAQRDMLQRLGCHAYQGFLFSAPMSPEDFIQKYQAS